MKEEEMSGQIPYKRRLFVYGTLRKGGLAADYLQGQKLLQQGLRLKGFAMYDAGWYPFVVPAGPASLVMGDVYEVEESLMSALDAYEGEGYVQHLLEEEDLLLYMKADKNTEGFSRVEEGDWLMHWKNKSREG